MGLGFSKEVERAVTPNSYVHSDCVIGDPSSLSDASLKSNRAAVPDATMAAIFDALEAKEYDLATGVDPDGAPLPTERRVGFIAQDVQQAIATHAPQWTNIVGSKPVGDEELLTLDYSRLCTVLWGKVKQLEARLAALE